MKQLMMGIFLLFTAGAMAQAPAGAPRQPGLTLTTPGFADGGVIPNKYTQAATGTPVSPELKWSHVPNGTVSFVLLTHDPDTALHKSTQEVLHWLMFNIPGTARELPEGVPAQAKLPDGSIQIANTHRTIGFVGMGAPAPGPYHHYTFELFALDTKLDLGPDATQADVMKAMDGHILGRGVLVGRFHKP